MKNSGYDCDLILHAFCINLFFYMEKRCATVLTINTEAGWGGLQKQLANP